MATMATGQRIMVVDDEQATLAMTSEYLKKWKYQTDTFSDPIEALMHFEKNSSHYPVVLTDIRMPDMGGLELARKMLRVRPDLKIILMTAFEITANELEKGLPSVKYEQVLQEPFPLKVLHDRVQEVFDN
jgi:CheY-like chemotaxis protein